MHNPSSPNAKLPKIKVGIELPLIVSGKTKVGYSILYKIEEGFVSEKISRNVGGNRGSSLWFCKCLQ